MALRLVSTQANSIAETVANKILWSPRAVVAVRFRRFSDDAAADDQADAGADDQADAGADDQADAGADDQADAGADDQADAGADDQADAGADDQADAGADDQADAGADDQADAGADDQADAEADDLERGVEDEQIQRDVDEGGRDLIGVRTEVDDARFRKGVVVAVLLLLAVGVLAAAALLGVPNPGIDLILREKLRTGDLVSGSAARLRTIRVQILNVIQARGVIR